MSRDIRAKIVYLREQNKKYSGVMVCVPRDEWPPIFDSLVVAPDAIFRSSRFLAQVFEEKDGAARISIQRTMIDDLGAWLDGTTWDELMRIKNQCGYAACWAVEIYPPDDEVVNVANMRHLWLLPEAPTFAWRKIK